MIVRQTLRDVPPGARAVALGSFDGVHLGHQAVIERAVAVARERDLTATVATFHPHPITVLRPELAPRQLSTIARRAALIAELEVGELVLIRFDHTFSLLSPDQFAEGVLAEALGARHVVVGANFRYGQGARGDTRSLEESGARLGFTAEAAPLLEIGGSPVSSSRIRDLLAAGDVEQAARLLGRPPWVEGAVVRGDGRGRELGFATANLAPSPRSALPAVGIYAGFGHLPGARRPAAISVGYNPTFSDSREQVRIEAHLLDFNADVYGSPIRLELTHRLRDEQRYGSVDELIAAVNADIAQVRTLTKA
jgi:riboflavin kinase/FMN adenylyltransferase